MTYAKRIVISDGQAQVLRTARDIGHLQLVDLGYIGGTPGFCRIGELVAASGFCRTHVVRMCKDMLRRDFLRVGYAEGSKVALWAISRMGLRALSQHRQVPDEPAGAGGLVPPKCINIFALPVYQTSKNAYYRNDGNGHIQSRGIGA